jgi:hypothetical protein
MGKDLVLRRPAWPVMPAGTLLASGYAYQRHHCYDSESARCGWQQQYMFELLRRLFLAIRQTKYEGLPHWSVANVAQLLGVSERERADPR